MPEKYKKEIEELANNIATKVCPDELQGGCGGVSCVTCLAEAIYNAGYRKVCSNAITNELGDIICGNDKSENLADFCRIEDYKNEVERLKEENRQLKATIAMAEQHYGVETPFEDEFDKAIKKAKQEAVKEFKKEIFALKTTLEDREHEVKELNRKVEKQDLANVDFIKQQAIKGFAERLKLELDKRAIHYAELADKAYKALDDKNSRFWSGKFYAIQELIELLGWEGKFYAMQEVIEEFLGEE